MKLRHLLIFSVLALGFQACEGYDDSALKKEIEDLKGRVAALEEANANANIASLWQIVNSIKDNKSVKSVTTFEDGTGSGYLLTFSDGSTIKLYNGKDGADAPVIGVREEDGVYYWTLTQGGSTSFLLDASGKKIPTTGGTPQLKIQDGWWMLSTDGGKTWTQIGKTTDGLSSYFQSVRVVGDKVEITTADGTRIVLPLKVVEVTDSFDENDIVASFAAISDTHIGNQYGSDVKFSTALNQLKAKAAEKDADGLDAVLIVGDLVEKSVTNVTNLKTRYEQVFSPKTVPMIYTVGNHDFNNNYRWDESSVANNAVIPSTLGPDYFLCDQDNTMRTNYECRHCVVGDYHIIGITPCTTSPITYELAVITWLDAKLKEITESDPGKYVVVLTHPMIYNTVYGSLLGNYWATEDSNLLGVLQKYPQVITFSGHLHFPINDPRSIWQGDFTSLGCASVSYMAFEGGNYVNKKSDTVLNDAGEYSEGLLLQFDASGNARVTRMDFYRNAEIGTPWEISYPKAGRSHLQKYNHQVLSSANTAPSLGSVEVTVGELSGNAAPVTLDFASGTDDEFVHHYSVNVKKGSTTVVSTNIMSDFYRSPQPSQMKTSWTQSLGNLEKGDYSLTLTAVDSWNAASEPVVKLFTVGPATGDFWTTDAAGSRSVEGGDGTASSGWLSYSSGTLSWSANTTGNPRSATITLPNGTPITVTQVEVDDFKGAWTLYSKTFTQTGGYLTASGTASTALTFGAPLKGETLPYLGSTVTNNIGITGLLANVVMDAALQIDYPGRSVQLGLFFDGRKGQAITSGSLAGKYAAVLPELCGSAWGTNYEFGRVDLGDPDYEWLWVVPDIGDASLKATYVPFSQRIAVTHTYSNDYIVGIEVMHFNGEDATDANLVRGTQKYTTVSGQTYSALYPAIYQANYNNSNTIGLYLTKNP